MHNGSSVLTDYWKGEDNDSFLFLTAKLCLDQTCCVPVLGSYKYICICVQVVCLWCILCCNDEYHHRKAYKKISDIFCARCKESILHGPFSMFCSLGQVSC